MEEPQNARELEETKVEGMPAVEAAREAPAELVGDASEMPAGSPAHSEMAFDKVDHDMIREVDRDIYRETSGMTIGDGFRFGCGFVLAMAIGTLAFLIVLTAFLAVGAIMGFKLPI